MALPGTSVGLEGVQTKFQVYNKFAAEAPAALRLFTLLATIKSPPDPAVWKVQDPTGPYDESGFVPLMYEFDQLVSISEIEDTVTVWAEAEAASAIAAKYTKVLWRSDRSAFWCMLVTEPPFIVLVDNDISQCRRSISMKSCDLRDIYLRISLLLKFKMSI